MPVKRSQLGKGQLVDKTKSQTSVLKHVVKAQVLDRVVRSVNILVRISEIGLDYERRWISSLGGGCVVAACVAALGFDKWDLAILRLSVTNPAKQRAIAYFGHYFFDVAGQIRVDEIGDNTNRFLLSCVKSSLNISSHILL